MVVPGIQLRDSVPSQQDIVHTAPEQILELNLGGQFKNAWASSPSLPPICFYLKPDYIR